MRNRMNLCAFVLTFAVAVAGGLGSPAPARATVRPTALVWTVCCERASNHCCGANWCAITERGCVSG